MAITICILPNHYPPPNPSEPVYTVPPPSYRIQPRCQHVSILFRRLFYLTSTLVNGPDLFSRVEFLSDYQFRLGNGFISFLPGLVGQRFHIEGYDSARCTWLFYSIISFLWEGYDSTRWGCMVKLKLAMLGYDLLNFCCCRAFVGFFTNPGKRRNPRYRV